MLEEVYIKFKVLFICLMIFISIASVSASDIGSEVTDADTGTVDSNIDSVNVLSVGNDNSVLGDDEFKSFSQLNATIYSVDESNVVELDRKSVV